MNDMTKPKFDGSTRMSPVEVHHAMKARVFAMKASGMKQKDIAAHFGISQQRVSQLVRMDLPEEDSLHSRAHLCPQRQRVIALAKEAKSLNHLYRLSGRGRSFVVTTLTLFAPDEFNRLRGGVKPPELDPEPHPPAVNWTERAQAFLPGDDALARSMSRLASFVGKTREGSEVRILPPGRIALPRVDEAAA